MLQKSRFGAIEHPDSDGKPLADNTKQLRWIVVLFGNLSSLYRSNPDVFVGADLLWYPVEGEPTIRAAPDAFVVFGRPKGDRGSYRQWNEAHIPLTVVFEIRSPGNSDEELADKLLFYETYGVEEYYLYDPDNGTLVIYVRQGSVLRRVRGVHGHVSPRLGIRFDTSGAELVVYHPNGARFTTFEEEVEAREQAKQRADKADTAVAELTRRTRRLVELNRKARQGQASSAELQELERLESEMQ